MSLVLTELSNVGIIMVADSAISYQNPATNAIDAHHTDWLKVLKVPRLKAGISYWGSVGLISRTIPFDKFLERVVESSNYNNLDEFADAIVSSLNKACKAQPLNEPVGIHIAGYSCWRDGEMRPTFYHVHNGHGSIRIEQQFDDPASSKNLIRTTGVWEGEPRKLFEKHLDFPPQSIPLQSILAILEDGYITRNGAYFPYLIINQGLDAIRKTLNTIPGITLPREPHRLGSRIGYLCFVMETVISIYNRSTLEKIIGGNVTAIGIHPDGRYEAQPSRKTRFSSIRRAQLRVLP